MCCRARQRINGRGATLGADPAWPGKVGPDPPQMSDKAAQAALLAPHKPVLRREAGSPLLKNEVALIRSILVAATAVTVAAATVAAGASAMAQEFSRSAYVDVTARKKPPAPNRTGPLAAVAGYLGAMTYLDRRRITVVALLDQEGRRVFRIRRICKSVERCGDDSVAESREALDLRRDKSGRWAIVWVGAQIRCHKGRGHRDWSQAPCV